MGVHAKTFKKFTRITVIRSIKNSKGMGLIYC